MTIRSLAFTALLAAGLVSCGKEETKTPEQTATATNANITLASIAIPTAQCEMCEETITDAVKKVPGVTEVKADAKADIAKVSYDPSKADLATIEQAIAKVGYHANNTVRDSVAYSNLPECCQE